MQEVASEIRKIQKMASEKTSPGMLWCDVAVPSESESGVSSFDRRKHIR